VISPFDNLCLEKALEEAEKSLESGNFPVGAVLSFDKQIFSQGGNYGESGQNYVFHAETKLLIEAGPQLLSASKAGKVISLFSTWEPCLMCLGIAVMNKVNRIIYIQKDPHSGSCGIDRSSLGVRYQEN